jgi:integrase
LASGTLARIHVVLRAALAQAQRWGWIWDNPAERAHRIVMAPRELSPPTPVELRLLLEYLREQDSALHAFVTLAAFTGARRAQLLGLRWRNVDLQAGRVSFTAGWVEGPSGPVLTATKTKRRHVVDLDLESLDVLAAHAHDCRSANGGALSSDGFVFADDPAGQSAWKPNRATKAFLRARRGAGLREFRLHDLRHFMATRMLDAGVPLPVVSRRLDHRRGSTTLDRYAHAVPGRDAEAAETLRRIVQQA